MQCQLLGYEAQIVQEMIEEDALCITAAGLGWHKVIAVMLKMQDSGANGEANNTTAQTALVSALQASCAPPLITNILWKRCAAEASTVSIHHAAIASHVQQHILLSAVFITHTSMQQLRFHGFVIGLTWQGQHMHGAARLATHPQQPVQAGSSTPTQSCALSC